MEISKVADIKFYCSDLDRDVNIRDYLRLLLSQLWAQQESFSGKRPFGNSGWEHHLYQPLVSAGIVQGTLDEDGYIESLDEIAAKRKIREVIDYIFEKK